MSSQTISAANIRLGADITGLIAGVRQASVVMSQAIRTINTGFVDAYRRADTEQKVFRAGLGRLSKDLVDISSKIALFGSTPILFGAANAYKEYAEIQKLKIALTQYGEELQTVKDLARLPNISIQGAAKSLISLRSVRMESELAQRAIKSFANALTAAGKSSADLDPALYNITQMLSTGKISAVDIKEMANRVPQARQAIIDAFGTADSEKLNDIGVQKVIEGLITELEKIPPVAGGASMAMEKFGDETTFAFASIGEEIDKAFGVTETINTFADGIGTITEAFSGLDPETKKIILTMTALTAAVPAVMLGLGGIAQIATVLAGGLGLAAGTVAAITAAVVVGGTLIVTHWDSIKASLVDSGMWSTLTGLVESTMGIVVEVFKIGINLIQGDWANLWTALVNVLKNAWNVILNIIGGGLKIIAGAFAELNKLLTMNSLAKGIYANMGSIDTLINKFSFDVPKASNVLSGALGKVKGMFEGVEKVTKKAGGAAGDAAEYYERMSKAAMEMYNIDIAMKAGLEAKALQDKIKAYKELYGVSAGLNVKSFEAPGVADMKWMPDLGKFKASAETMSDSIKKIKTDYQDTLGNFNFLDGLDIEDIKWYFDAIPKQADESSKEYAIRLKNFKKITDSAFGEDEFGESKLDQLKDYFKKIPQLAGESAAQYAERLKGFAKSTSDMSAAITSAVQEAAISTGVAFGEMFGDMMSGSQDALSNMGNSLKMVFGKLLKDIGIAMITYSRVIQLLKASVSTMNSAVAIAGGVLAIAAGTALQNSVKNSASSSGLAFAKGGMVFGEVQATVGDNPNARFDPEIIAPYSKIHDSIVSSIEGIGGTGSMSGELTTRLRGGDLEIAVNLGKKQNNNFK